MSRVLAVVLVLLVLPAPAAAEHPCDVLDKQTAEALIGVPVRDFARSQGSQGSRMPDSTVLTCAYRSVNWNPPRGDVMLTDSEYPSVQAATVAFEQLRKPGTHLRGDVVVKDKLGLGDAATIIKTTHEVVVMIVRGKKVVVARLTRQDRIDDVTVPDRAVDLLVEVAARVTRLVGPHPTTIGPMGQPLPQSPPPPIDPRTGLRPPWIQLHPVEPPQSIRPQGK